VDALLLFYWQAILPFSLICRADGFMRVGDWLQALNLEED